MFTAMRRMEAILLVFALLATPLALLASGVAAGPQGCRRFCCLPHAAHNSPMSQSKKAGKDAEMACHHGEARHMIECGMKSGEGTLEYASLAPIPPTVLSPSAKLAAPEICRHHFEQHDAFATPGILTAPFEPPRS
jgi:hypothetical protein